MSSECLDAELWIFSRRLSREREQKNSTDILSEHAQRTLTEQPLLDKTMALQVEGLTETV